MFELYTKLRLISTVRRLYFFYNLEDPKILTTEIYGGKGSGTVTKFFRNHVTDLDSWPSIRVYALPTRVSAAGLLDRINK